MKVLVNRIAYTILVPLLAGLGLVACAASSPQAGAPPHATVAFLSETGWEVKQWLGQPDESDSLTNGDTQMVYRWSRVQSAGGYTTSGGDLYTGSSLNLGRQYVPTRSVNLNCVARFTVAPDDKIRSVELKGNNCFNEAK
jgi:hypothetical protein